MEKFGIFELLDTLSALLNENSAPEAPEKQSPSPHDSAFSPPSYAEGETGALQDLLERHDKMSRRIGKKH